jgi:hypothetical protein
MKEVTRTIYEADDGTIFDSAEACKSHEAAAVERERRTTYWRVTHGPDLTEGRGWYGALIIEAYVTGYGPVNAMVEDYCFRKFGRKVAFVQGCAPTENWRIVQIDKDKAAKDHEARVGDYSYPAKRVKLVVGPKETGLTEATPPEAPGHGE